MQKEKEKNEYIDVCSLYPYVMVEHNYPVGHPVIITENFKDIRNYFGLVSCKVLPPKSCTFQSFL